MKLVREYNNKEFAINFSEKLKKSGIASRVYMTKGNNSHIFGGGPKLWGVAVILEEQLECAKKLMKNNNHEVKQPLRETEIEKLEKHFDSIAVPQFKLKLYFFLIGLAVLSILMIYFF